jgi:hypothetical protein
MAAHIQCTSPHALVHASTVHASTVGCGVTKTLRNLPKSFHYMCAWYLATSKSATCTKAIHPTTRNEHESIIMSFCDYFNTTIWKGTKNTHNLINYLCLIVVIHKDVRRLDVAMDNFRITWQQIKKLFFISDKQKLQKLSTNKQRARTKNSQDLGRWSSATAAGRGQPFASRRHPLAHRHCVGWQFLLPASSIFPPCQPSPTFPTFASSSSVRPPRWWRPPRIHQCGLHRSTSAASFVQCGAEDGGTSRRWAVAAGRRRLGPRRHCNIDLHEYKKAKRKVKPSYGFISNAWKQKKVLRRKIKNKGNWRVIE